MKETFIFEKLIESLPLWKHTHKRTSPLYQLLEIVARQEVEKNFAGSTDQPISFSPFGSIIFPYFKMGAVDSLDLFGLDELILFSFYWSNRSKYKKVLDIGANIGLHTFVLSKCGYQVQSFEPDSCHYQKLQETIQVNKLPNVQAYNAAVSNRSGTADFVRVLGNTTSSHLAGAKESYGSTEKFSVKIENIKDFMGWADLIKMDVEGHESELIRATTNQDWQHTDAVIEIGSTENAKQIWHHLQSIGVKGFSQKTNWAEARSLEDMPTSYKDGSLFISCKPSMPWG